MSWRIIRLNQYRRVPHPDIAGKGKTLGDLVSPITND
jgi:hypothetical protein